VPADEPVDGEVHVPAARTVERVKSTPEEPVRCRQEELFSPEYVWVEDVLRRFGSV
jgi:hypothetical protein